MNWTKDLLFKLVRPSKEVRRPEERRKVMVLSTLLLIYLVGVMAIFANLFRPSPHDLTKVRIILALCIPIYGACYALSRTRHYSLGGILFGVNIIIGAWMAVLTTPVVTVKIGSLPFLLIPLMVATFTLPAWTSFLFGILAMGSSLGFALITQTSELNTVLINAVMFNVLATFLLWAAAYLRFQDRLQLESERSRSLNSARKATLAELTNNITSDLNQPLHVISKFMKRVRRAIRENDFDLRRIDVAFNRVDNAIKSMNNMLACFSEISAERTDRPMSRIYTKTILRDALILVHERVNREDIDLKVTKNPTDLQLDCRSFELVQAILHLLGNAMDAVADSHEKRVRVGVVDKGEEVEFAVTDSGVGIPQGLQGDVTTALFTTKSFGEGSGLGLAMVQGVVSSHGGTFDFTSQPGYTRFAFTIPKNQKKLKAAA